MIPIITENLNGINQVEKSLMQIENKVKSDLQSAIRFLQTEKFKMAVKCHIILTRTLFLTCFSLKPSWLPRALKESLESLSG